MQIDYCLILAAGFGTRMGSIGQKLPKILWPIFEKTLLELQVQYALSLGVKNIYLNVHHGKSEIKEFCNNNPLFENIKILVEDPEILDIGGAIHNLAARPEVNYKGRLLVINGDQFFYLTKDEFFKNLSPFIDKDFILFTYLVNSSDGYNALELNSDRTVRNISKDTALERDRIIETYTGISIVNLSKLSKISGPSSFFKSVCNWEENKIYTTLLNNVDYWDFGTVQRYWDSSFKILRTYRDNSTHPFLRFLVNHKALKTWKINLSKTSYNANGSFAINLENEILGPEFESIIVIKGRAKNPDRINVIWWHDLFCEVGE